MKGFIEVHGATEGEPILIAVSDIRNALPVRALPPAAFTKIRAEYGEECRTIVNTCNDHLLARETYDQVKQLIEAAVS